MGWLEFFKKKPEEVEPLDLSWLQVDMHSHLIPGIDDGSKTMEESLELLSRLSSLGLKKIITTPHIMTEYYRNTPEIILSGLIELRKSINSLGLNIEVQAAAEYYMDEIFLEKIRNGEQLLTFGRGYILVETGFINKPQMFLDILFTLETLGYRPVLAHPERYQYLISDKGLLNELLERQLLFQVNLLSFTGFYSKPIKEFSEMLLERNLIAFLGTDCHNIRYLDMLESLPRNVKSYEKIKKLELINHQL